ISTFLSQSLCTSILRSWYLVSFSVSFCVMRESPGIATSTNQMCFFSIMVISGMLWARCLSVCSLKSHRILTSSVSRTFSTLCSHQLLVVGMLYFLHRFQCSIVATLSYLSLYSVWTIWVIISLLTALTFELVCDLSFLWIRVLSENLGISSSTTPIIIIIIIIFPSY